MMFSIILVTYNSADVIAGAIQSIPPGHEIIVVDNASTDRSIDLAEDLGAIVIRNAENLGFGTACNRGAAKARGDVLLFLNPDARLQPNALEALAAAMERYPQAAAFNPRIVGPKGGVYRRGYNSFLGAKHWPDSQASGDRSVPMGHGAALCFRKSVFNALGGFDENIFLFFEDDDLSARVIRAGHEIYHVDDAICMHLAGRSMPRSEASIAFREYHFFRSKMYILKKYGMPVWPRLTYIRYWIKRAFFVVSGQHLRALRMKARLCAFVDGDRPSISSLEKFAERMAT